jgi:hypothetical protein
VVTHDEALTVATRWFADAISDGKTSDEIITLVRSHPLVAGYVIAQLVEWARTGLTDEQAAVVAASLKSSVLKVVD